MTGADDLGEFSDAVAGIVLEGSSSDGCVVGDKDALSRCEVFVCL